MSKPAGKPHLPPPKPKLKNNNEDPSRKDKKSIWNWKTLKAISNVRNRRLFDVSHFMYTPLKTLIWGSIDLILHRLLLVTLEELEEEKNSGKWTTSFKLSSKAKGATMNVSLGYAIIGDNLVPLGDNQLKQNNLSKGKAITRFGHGDRKGTMRRVESLPSLVDLDLFGSSHPVEESDASAKPPSYFGSESSKENIEKETEDNGFSVVEQGIELFSDEQAISTVKVAQVETNPGTGVNYEECSHPRPLSEASSSNQSDVLVVQDWNSKDQCPKESLMRELKTALDGITNLETALDSPDPETLKTTWRIKLIIEPLENPVSLSPEIEPESPRERLLRQFEEDALASDVEQEHQMARNENNKMRAKVLEDQETEALMREWGLNEKAFQHSPPDSSGGFASPVHLPPEEPLELPPLGEGLCPFVQTKKGGFLRSMNPSLFSNAKNCGNMIMQVSNPVVVPVEMGSGIMDILRQLGSVGIEKLSRQANKLMPLEDITGKTMEQVAWETAPTLEGPERQCLFPNGFEVGQDMSGGQKKIEALSMEGSRTQSGMSDLDAPANISSQSIGEISSLQGRGFGISGSLGLDGTGGLQLMDIKNSGDDVDGLMGNNFTVALMVQLHDPIRNYEPVGAPMLSLIQVESVFVPPKPKIYRTVSWNDNQEDDDSESTMKKLVKEDRIKEENASHEEGIPQFRITEVHVAGLKTEPGKKLWGTKSQQQWFLMAAYQWNGKEQ
ncbi:Detected protein of unknown function [Hibiscus syriacus]|uniref:PMI1/PMIR1-2 C-terminal domain-containing protein n=1 Tax=Hibiscus syriacus TaxID=106335 RepID=A0A6A2WYY2_HIBSY|nr:Detected protein of unknown function [Hibiscus syriacus]